jgi:hypothetical protein
VSADDVGSVGPLTPDELRQQQRLLSDPISFPIEFKNWVTSWTQGSTTLSTITGAYGLPGSEVCITEMASNVFAAGTGNPATGVTVVAAPSAVFDGKSAVYIEFFAPAVQLTPTAAGQPFGFDFWDNASDLGYVGAFTASASGFYAQPLSLKRRITPTAGPHVFSIKAWSGVGTSITVVSGAAGGAGFYNPGFIRVTRV